MQGYAVLSTPLKLARDFLRQVLVPGDTAVDATVGKGRDLIFLTECVGESGRVLGFDIQPEALAAAEKLVGSAAELILDSHERLKEYCTAGSVKAVMFNLGYLPGGDHAVTTKSVTTEKALNAALEILQPGGLITVVVYPGHEAGWEEKIMLDRWLSELDWQQYSALKLDFPNRPGQAPFLLLIEKRLSQ